MRATFDEARRQLGGATDPNGPPTGASPAARTTAAGRTARRSRS
jgi:hypothetical protein